MSLPFKLNDLVCIKVSSVLVEAYCIGGYRKCNGEEWLVFEAPEGTIYFKPHSDFVKLNKKGPILKSSKF